MIDPSIFVACTAVILKSAPVWLVALRGTLLAKSREVAIDKGKEMLLVRGKGLVERIFHLDEKEQLRHLELALKNATERGLTTFQTDQERSLYQEVLAILSQEGLRSGELRREILQLFTLAENPDLITLNDIYNRRQLDHDPQHQPIDVTR